MARIAPTNILTNEQIIDFASSAGAISPVANVSERYSFVSTISVVDMLRDSGWLPVHAEETHVRKEDKKGFQKHFIRFARPEFFMENERIDLLLYNSHSTECAFKLLAGVWRFVCGNGLVIGNEYANFTHRHVGFNPDNFLDSAKQIASSAETIAERVADLKTIDLEPNEQGIYAVAAHRLVYGENAENAPIRPNQLLDDRRYEDQGNDLWTVFNRVQENVIKGGLRGSKVGDFGRRRRVTTRPVKALDRNKDLNQALWVLTERMAELKG
jgi:hypothetical protein